jgi:Lysylphosphatidylglycerol synthase TM region
MGALLLGGLLVVIGALPDVPRLLGVVAVLVGGVVSVAAVAILRIPADLERRAAAMAARSGAPGRIAARLAPVPQVAGTAARLALMIIRERPSVLVWPAVWWAFDVATLWACFHAFGDAPATGTLLLCYFLGQLGNLLPLPGGVGGTEGGMVGAFAASGVDAGLALIAVVSYQAISTYLPALPGLASYVDLRRRIRSWGSAEPEPAAGSGIAQAG